MKSLYNYVWGTSSATSSASATAAPSTDSIEEGQATEQTGLLPTNNTNDQPSAHDFFFNNESVQNYYRFTATADAPIVALHRQPRAQGNAGVTGLLRRSLVVPSHGLDETSQWTLVSVGGRSGWVQRRGLFRVTDKFRFYEAWMGNHAFWCNGRIMLGSDASSLLLSTALILVGMIFLYTDLLPTLDSFTPTSPYVTILAWLCGVSGVWTLVFLWWTGLTDPGIIPPSSSPRKAPPPTQTGYRYCTTCNIFRPPRSKHCNSCNVCVSVFDHHCPWVGSCVGQRNHLLFILFLFLVATLSTTAATTTSIVLVLAFDDWTQLVTQFPVTLVFGLFTSLCTWSLWSLFGYHVRTISIAQTTNERVRGVYATPSLNRNDRGCLRNWCEAVRRPPASKIPRRFDEFVCRPVRPERPCPAEFR